MKWCSKKTFFSIWEEFQTFKKITWIVQRIPVSLLRLLYLVSYISLTHLRLNYTHHILSHLSISMCFLRTKRLSYITNILLPTSGNSKLIPYFSSNRSPYSNTIPDCAFSSTGAYPGSHIALSYHVSLISFNLEQSLNLSLSVFYDIHI